MVKLHLDPLGLVSHQHEQKSLEGILLQLTISGIAHLSDHGYMSGD